MQYSFDEPCRRYRTGKNIDKKDLRELKHLRCLIAHEKRSDEKEDEIASMNDVSCEPVHRVSLYNTVQISRHQTQDTNHATQKYLRVIARSPAKRDKLRDAAILFMIFMRLLLLRQAQDRNDNLKSYVRRKVCKMSHLAILWLWLWSFVRCRRWLFSGWRRTWRLCRRRG